MSRCLLQISSLLSAQGTPQVSLFLPDNLPVLLPKEVSAPTCLSVVTKGHLVVTEDGEVELAEGMADGLCSSAAMNHLCP